MNKSLIIKASAPGKVILFGEHAVVYGKPALAGALDLRTIVVAKPMADGKLTLYLPDIGCSCSWEIEGICEKMDVFSEYFLDKMNPVSPSQSFLDALHGLVEKQEKLAPKGGMLSFLYLFVPFSLTRLYPKNSTFARAIGFPVTASAT